MSETLKLLIRVFEVIFADPELVEQFKAWLLSLFGGAKVMAATSATDLEAILMASAETESLCRQVAGRLNIDWKALIALILKLLPIILPIVLEPKPE